MANQYEYPKYLRLLQIGIGVVTIAAAIIILLSPGLAIFGLVTLLALTLFILGFGKIGIGIAGKYLRKSGRLMNIGFGVLAISLGVLALSQPTFTSAVVVGLFSFGLMLIGISTILHGVSHKSHSSASRSFDIGIGIITVFISMMTIGNLSFGLVFLAVLISTGFLILGIESLTAGIFGPKRTMRQQ